MTSLAALFFAFVVLTLLVIAVLAAVLRRRLAPGRGNGPDRAAAVPPGVKEE